MAAAYQHTRDRLGDKNDNWNRAAGPAAALWLSLRRVGWQWVDATTFLDDQGNSWDISVDPPVALVAAMNRTVRRGRFSKVAALHHGLLPSTPDVGSDTLGKQGFIVEFASTLAPVANGKTDCVASAPEFARKHASALLSAAAGGQWPQARKAAVPRWQIQDDQCQLCHAATGTLGHRLECPKITPAGGWSQIPDKARLAADTIGADRLQTLRTSGLMALKLPARASRKVDTMQWGKELIEEGRGDITWYIDGSQLQPRRRDLSTLGFGVAAVGSNGDLLAWGWGVPPKWCDSASAAEAWALCKVLQRCASNDRIVTDCLGLLKTAERGLAAATAAKMALARVWKLIAHHLDGDLGQLLQTKRLTWMPAHQTPLAIDRVRKSNGKCITAIDWRANHLVDGLAKLAAAEGATTSQEADLVQSAECLVKHCAAQLAVATYGANNCTEHYLSEQGVEKTRTIRDSQEAPKKMPKKLKPLAALEPKTAPPRAVAPELSDSESSSEQQTDRRARRRYLTAARRKAQSVRDSKALRSILDAKRKCNRTAVIDLHRRRLLAKGLGEKVDAPSSEQWSTFLNLDSSGSSHDVPTEAAASGGSSRACTLPSVTPAGNSRPEPEVYLAPNLEATVLTATRHRPTRGGSGITKADARAAVNALLGRPTKSRG